MSQCCGHSFCKSCLEKLKAATSVNYVCPMCRQDENFKTYPNLEIDRTIKQLKVYCPNKVHGCIWIGESSCVAKHLEKCSKCNQPENSPATKKQVDRVCGILQL